MAENRTLPPLPAPGERRFGRFNTLGLQTLALREMRRFLAVWTQTIAAPLVTAGLFLAIFSLALGPGRGPVMGVEFIVFLAPGILMMTVIQNAFANTSSSIVISKVQGNIVDTLMPPLSPFELMLGYLAGGAARGMVVAVLLMVALWVGLGIVPQNPLWVLLMVLTGSLLLSALGIVAGLVTAMFLLDMTSQEFIRGLRLFFLPWDVQFALIKSLSFGFTITSVGCFFGFTTRGGAEGVGRSTTRAVVVSSMVILVLDAFWAATLL